MKELPDGSLAFRSHVVTEIVDECFDVTGDDLGIHFLGVGSDVGPHSVRMAAGPPEALPNGPIHRRRRVPPQASPDDDAAQGKRASRMFFPPGAQVQHQMKAQIAVGETPFVNDNPPRPPPPTPPPA